MVCSTWCVVHGVRYIVVHMVGGTHIYSIVLCFTLYIVLHCCHIVFHHIAFVRFPRIIALLRQLLHCCIFYIYCCIVAFKSICVTDAATTAVGKLAVQRLRLYKLLVQTCAKLPIVKPLPSLHLRVSCKTCHLSKVCQLVRITICYYSMTFHVSQLTDSIQVLPKNPATGFASNFESRCN